MTTLNSNIFFLFIVNFLIVGCIDKSAIERQPDIGFRVPKIIDTLPETSEYKNASNVHISYYPIETVKPFGDTCKLFEATYSIWDTSIHRNVIQKSDGLQIYIDTQQYVTIKYDKENDYWSLSDTNQKYYRGYPCFIYNETKITKWLHIQDGDLVVTQEALDSNYNWRPIQIWSWPWCGNSNYRAPIKSDHYLLFKIPLYNGNFYTDIRLKIYSRDALYISDDYKGWINPKQFEIPKSLLNKDGTLKTNIDFIKID